MKMNEGSRIGNINWVERRDDRGINQQNEKSESELGICLQLAFTRKI